MVYLINIVSTKHDNFSTNLRFVISALNSFNRILKSDFHSDHSFLCVPLSIIAWIVQRAIVYWLIAIVLSSQNILNRTILLFHLSLFLSLSDLTTDVLNKRVASWLCSVYYSCVCARIFRNQKISVILIFFDLIYIFWYHYTNYISEINNILSIVSEIKMSIPEHKL